MELPAVPGVEHRFVDVRGMRMHVALAGEGDSVVLLHGWPQHWYAWRRVIPSLAGRCRLICPDLRGHGWSAAPSGSYAKAELTADVLALLDALELDRVRLVGHDWGGWIGYLMCLRVPERVERFLALSIMHPWLRGWRDPLSLARLWYQFVVATPALGPMLVRRGLMTRLLLRHWAGPDFIWEDEERATFVEPLREPARAAASSRIYRTFLLREFLPLNLWRYGKQRLTVPTLHLLGTRDPILRAAILTGYEAHAEDMLFEPVPDAGHFLPEERPELVCARAVSHLGL
jgi:pimeloyl-ACP methyl ester carboxylesterase